MRNSLFLLALLATPFSNGHLTEPVGPLSDWRAKRSTICNVADYGGAVGCSDIGPAISRAFSECVVVNPNSTLYVPPGNYPMQTWVNLNHGSQWAFQLDGLITRTSTSGGNMIMIINALDFEFFSSTSAGGIQGNGYQCRNAGPRLIRIVRSTNFAIHDLILADSPEFHLVLDTCSRGEVYNMAISGADLGGSDGIDVWGENLYIHDVQITNRDECVTVKSPSHNILVEAVYCNQSGGCAIGSLGANTSISNVTYNNVYTNGGNQAFMIKSNGGSGTVSNITLQNFIFKGTAYGLDINQQWAEEKEAPGDGVQLTNITVANWDGMISNGQLRPALNFICAPKAPCQDIDLIDVNVGSENGNAHSQCQNAWGYGSCLKNGTPSCYYSAVTSAIPINSTLKTLPSLTDDLSTGFDAKSPIPIPKMPNSFYPNLAPKSALARDAIAAKLVQTRADRLSPNSDVFTAGAPESTNDMRIAVTWGNNFHPLP